MLKESGSVVAIEEDGLWVETIQQSACASCAAKTGCGTQVLAKLTASQNMTFVKAFFDETSKGLDWKHGDRAILGIKENALVLAALIAYGLPLISMLIFAVIAAQFFKQDGLLALSALLGIGIGALIVKVFLRFNKGSAQLHAVVLGQSITSPEVEVSAVKNAAPL